MFKKRIIILTVFLLLFLLTGSVLAKDYGLKATQKAAGLSDAGSVPVIVGNVLGSVLSLVGVLFFALMLYGGIVWMMARGNQEDEKKALSTITAAIIGIVIVVSSYAITNFVFVGMKGTVGDKSEEEKLEACFKSSECSNDKFVCEFNQDKGTCVKEEADKQSCCVEGDGTLTYTSKLRKLCSDGNFVNTSAEDCAFSLE